MKDESVKLLLAAIKTCIYGPGGDPIEENLLPAANMVRVLRNEGHGDVIRADDITELEGKNIEERNYLE